MNKFKFGVPVPIPDIGGASTSSKVNIAGVGDVSVGAGWEAAHGLELTGNFELSRENGNVFTSGAFKKSQEDTSHQAISSYFIGPQAENISYFQDNINVILKELQKARGKYFPSDGEFITDAIQDSDTFKQSTQDVSEAVQKLSELLGKHSIPFWSPRYQAHMCMDMNMPALLGYFATMLYNPNNVALEASPLSTIAEMRVGEQLCELFGYNIMEQEQSKPLAWGHVTCDGTIANLESIWVARNLKFYPLSLRESMDRDGPLNFVAPTFKVRTCQNEEKLFAELSPWELLNLKAETILDLPDRLNTEYGISSKYMEKVLGEYSIQSRGKDALERKFGIEKPGQIMLSGTRHYSWPKGGAIAGIGSNNIVGIPVDYGARIDLKALEKQLEENLKNQQAVYAVVAIIGSTEEGAVDRLGEIVSMRRRFQAQGLSFTIHADAAWGGYFASMLPRDYNPGSILNSNLPVGLGSATGFVPDSSLRAETQEDIWWLRYADSITVDPHKAGYIPYPAGGLCYRDGRMRYLVTWTSPYLSQGSTSSIGIYGVEGSKPGASAISTYMANKCIGLKPEGYGALLGEVTFTCSRLSAWWAAMTDDKMPFVVVPFNMLPSELKSDATPESIEKEKQWIRDHILTESNMAIATSGALSPDGLDALTLLRQLGSDLNINAFALNFRHSDGTLNRDVVEANNLMKRVVQRLSIDSPGDDPTSIPLYITSTEFSPELYGECAEKFKERLGLKRGEQDLFVLRNVVMSPFPTDRDFIGTLAGTFRDIVLEECETSRKRTEASPDLYEFIMHGEDSIYFVHMPDFNRANMRRQTIFEAELSREMKEYYLKLKRQYPEEIIRFQTADAIILSEVLQKGGSLHGFLTSSYCAYMYPSFPVHVKNVLKDHPLNGINLDASYPANSMPFYLYGNDSTPEYHIDHILLKYPNIQLSAEKVSLELDDGSIPKDVLRVGAVVFLDDIREDAMQPFPEINVAAQPRFFFQAGKSFKVTVYRDPLPPDFRGPGILERLGKEEDRLASGTLTLRDGVYVDSVRVNRDPYAVRDKLPEWEEEFDKIGRKL